MTTINIHGVLGFEFGTVKKMYLNKAKHVFNAISANQPNFLKRILELADQGMHYSIVIDGKDIKNYHELETKKMINQIDIVPIIVGTGKVWGAIMTVVGVVLMFIPGMQPIGIMLMSIGIQMMLAPKQDLSIKVPEASVGTASAVNQSFFFSNTVNLAQQGSPVPIGYGRLRIGSMIIQSSIKSFAQTDTPNQAKLRQSTDSSINSVVDYANITSRS